MIRGYHAEIDPRALGYALSVVIRIRPAPRELRKVADVARETPEIVQCDRVTGEDCYVMRAHVRDVEHLEEVIDRFAIYGQTTSSIVQSSPVPARGRQPRSRLTTRSSTAGLNDSPQSRGQRTVLPRRGRSTSSARAAAASERGGDRLDARLGGDQVGRDRLQRLRGLVLERVGHRHQPGRRHLERHEARVRRVHQREADVVARA